MSELGWRDHVLMVISTFVVANVRYLVQYNKWAWERGILALLIAMLIHYFGLFLVAVGVLAILHAVEKKYELDSAKLIRYVYATALVLALSVLFIYFSSRGGGLSDEEYMTVLK